MKRSLTFASLLHGALLALALLVVRAPAGVSAGLSDVLAADFVSDSEARLRIPAVPLSRPPVPQPVDIPPPHPLEIPETPVIEPPLPQPRPMPVTPRTIMPPTRPLPPLIVARPAAAPAPEAPRAENEPPPAEASRVSGGGAGADTAPALVQWTPPRGVRERFKGRVVAVIDLDAAGALRGVRLDVGTGRRDWDDALLRALREARYRAAQRAGRAVAASLRQPIVFE